PVRVALAAGVAVTFGYGLVRHQQGDGLTRDDYRGAVGYVNAREQPGDAAITNAWPGFAYYHRGAMPIQEFPTGRYDEAAIVAGMNQLAVGHGRIWYLSHDLRPSDPEGFVDMQLKERGQQIEERSFGQIRVTLYRIPNPPAFAPLVVHR